MRTSWIATLAGVVALAACYKPSEPHYACPSGNSYARPMGWNPDATSALSESEVRASTDIGHLATDDGDYRYVGTGSFGARYAGETVTFHADINPAVVESTDNDLTPGNVRLGMGLRTISTNLGGLYRRGLAIRAAMGIDPWDTHGDRMVNSELSSRRAIDRLRFASGQTYEQVLEARYELVGCHAPFVHIQAGFRARKDADTSTFAAPFSITVGGHPNAARFWKRVPHSTLYLEYASVLGRLPTTDDRVRLAQRARLGLVVDDINLSFHLDSLFGVGDGVIFGVTSTLPFKWGK